jgi:hypothetical protein
MSMFNKREYPEDRRKFFQLIAFGAALQKRLPKKYHSKAISLIRSCPQLGEILVLETNTSQLGLLWGCQASEIPRLLKLMTARCRDEITYTIGEPQPTLGRPVQIRFAFPELSEEEI